MWKEVLNLPSHLQLHNRKINTMMQPHPIHNVPHTSQGDITRNPTDNPSHLAMKTGRGTHLLNLFFGLLISRLESTRQPKRHSEGEVLWTKPKQMTVIMLLMMAKGQPLMRKYQSADGDVQGCQCSICAIAWVTKCSPHTSWERGRPTIN